MSSALGTTARCRTQIAFAASPRSLRVFFCRSGVLSRPCSTLTRTSPALITSTFFQRRTDTSLRRRPAWHSRATMARSICPRRSAFSAFSRPGPRRRRRVRSVSSTAHSSAVIPLLFLRRLGDPPSSGRNCFNASAVCLPLAGFASRSWAARRTAQMAIPAVAFPTPRLRMPSRYSASRSSSSGRFPSHFLSRLSALAYAFMVCGLRLSVDFRSQPAMVMSLDRPRVRGALLCLAGAFKTALGSSPPSRGRGFSSVVRSTVVGASPRPRGRPVVPGRLQESFQRSAAHSTAPSAVPASSTNSCPRATARSWVFPSLSLQRSGSRW